MEEPMSTDQERNATNLSEQAIKLAEQLGRIAGTIEGTAQGWLERQQLAEQLTRVRDGAATMLGALTREMQRTRLQRKKAARGKTAPPARQADDLAHAPGKRRRKPAPTMKGVKKSDEAIPKLRTARAVRQRRKSYA
jgi:hypothetical protein